MSFQQFLDWFTLHPPVKDSPYIKALKDDWLAENSESREEDVTRQQLEARIAEAEKAAASVEDPTKLLDLAEAYGVLNPREQRCLETCELVMKFALPFLNRRRQGDANQLQGRCLFLQNDFEGALRAVLRAQECYKDQGTKALRRSNNAALLRCYCALENGEKAGERFKVALTMVETKEDALNVYLTGKAALDGIGYSDLMENLWEDHLDDNPETKAQLDGQMQAMKDLSKQVGAKEQGSGEPEDELKFPENLGEALEVAKRHQGLTLALLLGILLYLAIAIYISLWVSRVITERLVKKTS
mmetsp:Transcript_3071/g.6379  ORF Transcript_3071/g.6379 Transcript_3071/m.6379 type:complete len:301 (+) Transcript_3071:47-949(+)